MSIGKYPVTTYSNSVSCVGNSISWDTNLYVWLKLQRKYKITNGFVPLFRYFFRIMKNDQMDRNGNLKNDSFTININLHIEGQNNTEALLFFFCVILV